MKEISIKGITVIVDDGDYDKVTQYRWHLNKDGYAVTNIWINGREKRTSISMHRFVMGCVPRDGKEVDHINGNRLDNRKENLRFVTHQQNTWNSFGKNNKSSKYKGITRARYGGFEVSIRGNNRDIFLGARKDEVEAARLYDTGAVLYYGEFAKLNFPDNPPTEEEIAQLKHSLGSMLIATNKTGYYGVSYHKTRKWYVGAIVVNGKDHKLTPCKTALEAAIARDKLAYQLLGDKAKLNFPDRIAEYNLTPPS